MTFPILQRARAAYLGLAVGDALGATTEFMLPREIRAAYGVHREIIGGGWLRLRPGRVTDDTEMNLALGEALLESGKMDPQVVADKFVAWMRSKPVDIGNTIRRGLRRVVLTGSLQAEYSEYSAGNGAAMRNLPVILATLKDDRAFREWSLAQARITHNHPESDAGTLILGDLTRCAILQGMTAPLRTLAHDWITRHPAFDYRHYKGEAEGYIVHTVKTVLHFFFNAGDFESCLIGVVNQGGDADTNGALAGMLAGAFYGPEAIPGRWVKRLDVKVREVIERQVADLLEKFPPKGTSDEDDTNSKR
ncbi:MAG: ADP-ribosyl-[dinitrogen reductase] hydrolase [Nitrospirae bacterium]|nr:ADP-ribosyl-[dinitrogen reductase] hydrolase [Nitrospirota bacterium]